MLGKKKNIKTFDDLELDSKPMPMAAECCLAEDVFVPTKAQYQMIEDLEYIKDNYKENWDGEGAKPINDKVYENALSVITQCNSESLGKWEISLNNNGSLYFSAINEDAMINLGNYTFSYYVKRNGKKMSSSNSENYSAKALISVLTLI